MGAGSPDDRLVVLGPHGAGKGTQGRRIARTYGLEYVEMGALVASAVSEGHPALGSFEEGDLVPDDVVNRLAAEALPADGGWVLDGYPRTTEQAAFLDDRADLDAAVLLDVPEPELVARLSEQVACAACNRPVRTDDGAAPPDCPECGGDLLVERYRPEETRKLLAEYRTETLPVVDCYRDRGLLVEVDGNRPPDRVWADLETALERRL